MAVVDKFRLELVDTAQNPPQRCLEEVHLDCKVVVPSNNSLCCNVEVKIHHVCFVPLFSIFEFPIIHFVCPPNFS